jgi:hypothetical protein
MLSNRSEETDNTTKASADSQLTLEHPPGQVRDRHNETIHQFETQTHNKQQSDVLQPVYKDIDALQTGTQTNVYKSQQTTHLMVSNQSTRTQTHFKRVHKQMSTSPIKQLI